jgi:hypothetical protein
MAAAMIAIVRTLAGQTQPHNFMTSCLSLYLVPGPEHLSRMPILSRSALGPEPAATRERNSRPFWWSILGLAALFLLMRWNNFNAPLIRDEGEYAYAAQILAQGHEPYREAFIQKPPMVVYSYLLADSLLPQAFWAPRVLAAGVVAMATALLGFIARREFGRGFALPAMWLMTPLVFLPGIGQFTANTEMFLLLPMLGVFAVYCHGRLRNGAWKHWFAAGFLAVTALLYKYTALPVLAFVLAVWWVETWRAARSFRSCAAGLLALALGGFLAALLELGFFLVHDGGASLWDCTVTFNRHYLASDNFGWSGLGINLKAILASWWFLVLLIGAAFLRPPPRFWFWCGALLCAGLTTGASYYSHYYILPMPFCALLAAAGIHALATILARRSTFTFAQIGMGLTVLTLCLLLLPDAPWLTFSPQTFVAAKFAGHSVFLESPVVGRRVAELSSPGDRVWVAASEPQILCYAHRTSATRFITVYALVIPSPELGRYQTEAIREVREHPPKLIVWAHSWLQDEAQPSACLLFLNETLARDYHRVGGYVLEAQSSHWAEPLSDDQAQAASVVLYERGR